MAEKIQKIYDLQELGGQQVLSILEQINKQFVEIKRSKIALNRESLKATLSGDTEASRKLQSQLEVLVVKELELKNQRQALIVQGKQQQVLRAQELAQQRQLTAGNEAVAGSFYDIAKRYRELSQIAKFTISLSNKDEIDNAQRELKALKEQLDNFNRSQSPDGTLVGEYKTGIINAFKQSGLTDLIQGQLTQAKTKVKELDDQFEKLKVELREVQATGQGSLNALEQQLIENRTAAGQLTSQIGTIEQGLRGTGTIGQQITESLKNSFRDLGKQIVQVALGYVGFQAAIGLTQKAIRVNYDLSDRYTDLQRVLSATDEEFESIRDHLREINTRTPLTQLADFAFIGAKAGVAKAEIAGVTAALDQLYIVAGKSLGDPEKTFESLVKLNTIFNNGAPVTAENLQKLGNAIIQLDNAGVASGGYIVDFAERLAGIEGITSIAITSVLGLAAAFEENGASAEVAATATSQVIVKLYSDTAKYAEIAGVTKKAFEDLLNTNPGEALLKVAAGLKGNAQTATEFAAGFAELEAKGARVQAVMGTLADKTDYFRQKIQLASTAIKDNTAIQEGAEKKQKNFAASVDQIKKSFELAFTSDTVVDLLNNAATGIKLLIYLLPLIIKLFTLWVSGWFLLNTQMLIARARLVGYTIALALLNKAQMLANIATAAYNAVLGLTTGITTAATAATRLWGIAMTALPIGWLIAIIGALVAVVVSVGAVFAGNTQELRTNALAAKLNGQIQEEVSKQTAGTIAKINAYTSAIKDNTLSHAARKRALEALIAISPEYLGRLTLENIATAEGTKIIDNYVKALRRKAEATAIDEALTAAQKRKNQAELEEFRIASDPDYAKKKYNEEGGAFFASLRDAIKYGTFDSEKAFYRDKLQKEQKEAQKEIDFYTGKVKKDIQDGAKEVDDAASSSLKNTIGARQKALEEQITGLKASYKALALTDKQGQKANIEQRKKLQEELDALDEDKNQKKDKRERAYGGAKLTGETKDELKEIDAQTATLKAALEQRKLEGKISEIDYYIELNKITQDGIEAKLKIVKDGNAEEKKQRAELKLDAVKSVQETNDAIQKIEESAIVSQYESNKKAAENRLKLVTENANSTDLERAEAQLAFDEKMIAEQINFGNKMDDLERRYNVSSVENAHKRADELLQIKRKEATDQTELNKRIYEATFQAINRGETTSTINEDKDFAQKQAAIYGDFYLSEAKRKADLEKLERQHQANLLDIQRAGIWSRILELERLHNSGIVNEKEYKEQIEKLQGDLAINSAAQAKTSAEVALEAYKSFQSTLTDIIKAVEAAQQNIIGPLFALQKQQIDQEQETTEAQQDEEKKRRLIQATSEAQKEAIEKEFEQKRTESAKKYGEQRRSIALKELAIESALAAIKALATASNIYEGFAYAALVGIQYLIKRQQIQQQKFEKGGRLKKTLNDGGRFSGPSHTGGGIPFVLGGSPVEVEGQEGYVVNKKSMASSRAMTVTGTPAQIASASNVAGGGYDFAPGARVMRYEYGGSLGTNMTAPVINPYFSPSFSNGQDNSKMFEIIMAQTIALQSVNERIDNMKVVLNPNTVTQYQKNKTKAVGLGTL
ncbi:MAG: phage tail tape measure protein [Taibaiella sp.]|jgi:tubulin-specific chaperone A